LGIAYNSTNLTVNGSNQLDTIQGISTAATPVFAGMGIGIGTAPAAGVNVTPVYFSSGTASQSGSTITGTVNFPSGVQGMKFLFADGTDGGTITNWSAISQKVLTVTTSQTVASQAFKVYPYPGIILGNTGTIGVGTAPDPLNGIKVVLSSAGPTSTIGVVGNVITTRDASNIGGLAGLNFVPQWIPSTLTGNRTQGLQTGATSGVYLQTPTSGGTNTATLTTGNCFITFPTVIQGATGLASITTLYHYKVGAPGLTGGGQVGTQYGFYDPGLAATSTTIGWGCAINTQSYFNAAVAIGKTTAPTANTLEFAATYNIAKDTNDLTLTTAAQKTLVFGTPIYRDLWVGLDASRLSGTTNTVMLGNIRELVFSNNDTADFPSVELQHDYKEGTNLDVHMHIVTRGTNASAYHVRYTIEYTWADTAAVFPATTTLDVEATIPGGTTEFTHIYIDVGDITGTGKHVGSHIKFLLKKIASASSDAPVANNPYVLQVGMHYLTDTVGSRQETVK
jgi:hypothetical protein